MTKTDKTEPEVEQKAPTPDPKATAAAGAEASAKEVGTPFLVSGGPIAPWGNGPDAVEEYGEKARMYDVGEVVTLTSALARHYNKMDRLKPFIADDPAE